jgi:uncharacterized protein YecT (DUF1311 family)
MMALTVSAAHSQDNTASKTALRPSYGQCLDAAQGLTIALNNCIGSEYDFQDKRLNTAYKALRQSLSNAQRSTLRDQELAWITSRDKACAPPADGGTADMLSTNECRLGRTAQRAAELEVQIVQLQDLGNR